MRRDVCMTCVMDKAPAIFWQRPMAATIATRLELPARVAKSKNGNFDSLVVDVKNAARGDYDCVIGVSGGVDSSYVLYMAKKPV